MTDLSINKLYTYQRGFRKEFGKQHCLFVMIKKSWKMQDSNGLFAAVFTDISKAFWLYFTWIANC